MSVRHAGGIRAAVLAVLLAAPAPAHALRVVTWNLLNYDSALGNNTITQRQPHFRTVMANLGADVIILQELRSIAARDSFLTNVLNVVQPGEWTGSTAFDVNNGEYMAVLWKPARAAVSNFGSFATSQPYRRVFQCLVKPAGYLTNPGWFRLYSIHLKAGGPGTVDSTTRRIEATDIRNTLNAVNQAVVGPNFVIGGDSNIYGSYEGAYIRFTESQPDNDGRCVDPVPVMGLISNWHQTSGLSPHYTQAPCFTCPSYTPSPGFSGGGLDDRFDLFLTSTTLANGEGLDAVQSFPYGNDGQHYNTNINGPPTNSAVGQAIADALWAASDHLPVVLDLSLPSRISAPSSLAFGDWLVGATAEVVLNVNNAAAVPGDDLDYSFAFPAGFAGMTGPFSAPAGGGNPHTLAMDASSAGMRSGTLVVTTDDPDSLTKQVLLSGRVLRHAVPSLDSLTVLATDTLRFGAQDDPGNRLDRDLRVHNQGFDGLQARLSLENAVITGGGARFSLAGGFTPVLIGATGQPYTVHFDTTGAVADTVYEATLTLSGADEPLPGAQPAPDLVIALRAGTPPAVGVPGCATCGIPATLAFHPPRPNPLRAGATSLGFDLPRAARVALAVYDATGRRVATLVDGERAAGRHHVRWDAHDEVGARVPAGLYFARFRTPGLDRTVRLIVLP